MLQFNDIVFGPIVSRRLGTSLGINILPSRGKLCNFDCIYCECGWNADGADDKKFPDLTLVVESMRERISRLANEGISIDSITFSGNGEPTINPDFPKIIDEVLKLRDEFYPSAKISVLSNATMAAREDVFQALRKIDNPIMKIDACCDDLAGKINKPVGTYSVEETVRSLERFGGDFILQTMFLKSREFDSAEPGALDGWMNIVRHLKPREIMVYTIDRQTPDGTLEKYSEEQMAALVQPLINEGFKIQIKG